MLGTNGEGHVPIGHRVALWRHRRGITVTEMASSSSLTEQLIRDIEAEVDWVDRHRVLFSLAAGLRLDPTELTGQPYEPHGTQHGVVRAAAWHLRRHVVQAGPRTRGSARGLEELRAGVEDVRAAQAAGDEHALALRLPALLELADRACAEEGEGPDARAARTFVYVAAAGLLRRLGYRDLAWSLLHRAGPGVGGDQFAASEEIRLLTSMGLPETAADRATQHLATARSVELLCAAALAHASAGRRHQAEALLGQAGDRVGGEVEAAEVAVATAGSAMQFGVLDEVLELEAVAASMPSARRADLLLFGAEAWARGTDADRAAESLAAAEDVAPLYIRLDPLARELLHALRSRVRDANGSGLLVRMAGRFGMM
ncbi:DNA-binding protein [Streptomyces sp. NPDC001691]|uniref:DNA-binding protein n=1 Tax=Streptomyces sp. NPDC001691 TaxID=3364600 RepID=UPI0036CA957C